MNTGEIKRIKDPIQKRLSNAYGQLTELEKEIRKGSKKGDLNLVIRSQTEVSQLRGKLNGLTGEDLEVKVAQLDKQVNDILKKLQQQEY